MLQVGKCKYDVILVPNLRTIRSTTLEILQNFTAAGGKVIIAGSAPEFIDAQVQKHAPVIPHVKSIFWSRQCVLEALEQYRELRILTEQGPPTDKLLYQMRQDDKEGFVFICNTDRNSAVDTIVGLKGQWKVKKLDTFTGEDTVISSTTNNGWTVFPYRFEGCGSLLLRLLPSSSSSISYQAPAFSSQPLKSSTNIILSNITLSEPNVLMLDYASDKLDSEPYSQSTEVLRIDNVIRSRLRIPAKGSAWKQPWTVPASERAPRTHVTLRFNFTSHSDIVEPTKLALEDLSTMEIQVNNLVIPSESVDGYWVDEAIKTVPIPANIIKKGTNTIILSFPFGILSNIERIYFLGSFSVSLKPQPSILPLDLKTLTWGDITTQGLPFYVGNVIYHCNFSSPSTVSALTGTTTMLSVPSFSSPVLSIHDTSTSEKLGRIAFQPHTLSLPTHTQSISITAFGNRYNAFGHIHLQDGITDQCWPDIWRSRFSFLSSSIRLSVSPFNHTFPLLDMLISNIFPSGWRLVDR
jgi:hypothetical protein